MREVPAHTTRIGTHLIQPISRSESSGRTRVRCFGSARETAWAPRPEPKTKAEPPVNTTRASVSHSTFRILEFFVSGSEPAATRSFFGGQPFPRLLRCSLITEPAQLPSRPLTCAPGPLGRPDIPDDFKRLLVVRKQTDGIFRFS